MTAAGIPQDSDDTAPSDRATETDRLSEDLIAACARHDHRGAAIAWARMGVKVLPVWPVNDDGTCACPRVGCRNAGKHPLAALVDAGVHDATTDVQTIREWFFCWADANVGVAMGGSGGLVALDVDPRNGGTASIAAVHAAAPIPRTATEVTDGGGEHRLFRLPRGDDQPSFHPPNAPGLEVKGTGSYIVTAPARHASLNRYAWRDWASPIAPAPAVLRQRTSRDRRGGPRVSLAPTGREEPWVRAETQRVIDALLPGPFGDRVARLLNGVWTDYPSPSEADAALASYVSFVSDQPEVLQEALLRSGLNPKKYVRPDHLERTIGSSLAWRIGRRTKNTTHPVIDGASCPLSGAGTRGKSQRRQVARAVVRHLDATPTSRKTETSFARLPIAAMASCLGVDRTTVWRAVKCLVERGLVESLPVERTRLGGRTWTAIRWLRLTTSLEKVLEAIDRSL